jgi:hypothetical protein
MRRVVVGVKKSNKDFCRPYQECPGIGYGLGIGYNLSGNSSEKTASSYALYALGFVVVHCDVALSMK